MLLLSAGLWFALSLPCSVAAVVCALVAGRRARGAGQADGGTRTRVALVLGVLGVVLGLIAAVVWIWLLFDAVDVDGILDELERQDRDPGERQA